MATKKNLSLKEKYPEIYAQTNIDRTEHQRVVPMEVLSLGLGRTGTMSMKAAYEILGYPTYHYVSMMENPPDLDLWLSALRRKYSPQNDEKPFTVAEWDALLGHVSAVTDSPINAFAPELISAYPDAKVVLVEREVESWYRSFEKNVISSFAAPMTRVLVKLDPEFIGKQGKIGEFLMRGYWQASSFDDWKKKARQGYLEHNALIKKLVPKERLLVYKLGSGWVPLCGFLGKEIPEVEFPRVNETEELQERVFLCLMLGLRRSMLRYARMLPFMIPLLVSVWYLWRIAN
ncbi:hypothetical protein KCU61_g2847, partial [Aureobasidium melanogenum]